MNWDRNRNSGFAQIMEKFIWDYNFIDVWDKFPVEYTHIHTDFKSTSTIDRILTNERLLNVIQDAGALHIGDNPSRHSPIYLKFDVGILPLNKVSYNKNIRKPAWYKAENEQIDEYTLHLSDNLRRLQVPSCLNCVNVNCEDKSHSDIRDGYMLDLLCNIEETLYIY